MRPLALIIAAALFFAPPALRADEAADYVRQVKPVLAEKCLPCQGALQQKGGLRLDTVKLMREGGDQGPVVGAGQSGKSPILDRVLGRGGARRMPPDHEGEPL